MPLPSLAILLSTAVLANDAFALGRSTRSRGGTSAKQLSIEEESTSGNDGRTLQQQPIFDAPNAAAAASETASLNGTSMCSICGSLGAAAVFPNVTPWYPDLPTFPQNLTCNEVESFVTTYGPQDGDGCRSILRERSVMQPQCCNMTGAPVPTHECEKAVQTELFETREYNSNVVPLPPGGGKLDITVEILFLHLVDISTKAGTAEMYFHITLNWTDPQLTWDAEAKGGCLTTNVRASLDAEKTDIWVPDFDLLNRIDGVQSFPDKMAFVQTDGVVSWGRLGGVTAFCAFEGLEKFPYDILSCYLDFGTVELYPRVQYLFDPRNGLQIHDWHQPKYQEFEILPDRSRIERLEPSHLRYWFYFQRASPYYTRTIVVTTILLTMLSFGMFLLDVRLGERLGFGVSLLLVIVAQSLLTADVIPICNETLWVTVFSSASLYWTLLACFESVAVATLYMMDTKNPDLRKDEESSVAGNMNGNGLHALPENGRGSNGNFQEGNSVVDMGGRHEEGTLNPIKGPQLTLKRVLMGRDKPNETWEMATIRRMDRLCLILFPVSYTIFFSVMLARNKHL